MASKNVWSKKVWDQENFWFKKKLVLVVVLDLDLTEHTLKLHSNLGVQFIDFIKAYISNLSPLEPSKKFSVGGGLVSGVESISGEASRKNVRICGGGVEKQI